MSKAKTITIVFLLLILSVPVASAFTWTVDAVLVNDIAVNASTAFEIDGAGMSDNTYLVVAQTQTANDAVAYRRTIGGSGTQSTIYTNADTLIELHRYSSTVAVVCFEEFTNDDPMMGKTVNGGLSWTTSTIDAADQASSCTVFPVTSSLFVAAYADATNNNYGFKSSSNAGGTWGSEVVITTATDVNGAGYAHVAAADANNMVAITSDDGASEVIRCVSEDGGATWPTCGTLIAATAARARLEYMAGAYWVVARDTATNGVNLFKSTDGGYTWETQTPFTSTITHSADFWAFNETHLIVSGGISGVSAQKISYSTDGGLTWTSETSMTDGAVAGGQGANFVTVTPDGIAVAGYELDPSSGNVHITTVTTEFSLSATLGAEATATVSGLTGFDVDRNGGLAIARTDDTYDQSVSIYNAQTLGTPVGGPIPTNCGVGSNDYEDAVLAKNSLTGNEARLVAFLNCDAGGDAQYFSIRQSNGDVPTDEQFADTEEGETCIEGTQCPSDIDLSEFGNVVDNGLGQLGQVEDFPIDYSNNFEPGIIDFRHVAWAFASQQCDSPPGPGYCTGTEPGYVGVATFTATDDVSGNNANEDHVEHHPSQDVDDFCFGLDEGSYYIASVVPGQPGFVWPVTFDGDTFVLDATIGSPNPFGSSGSAIDCSGGEIFYLNGDDTVQLLTRTGVFLDSVESVDGAIRGITISEEFYGPDSTVANRGKPCAEALQATNGCVQFGAYVDDTDFVIVDLTGGIIAETHREPLPSGTFHSIIMDANAQNIWVATSTTIARFDIVSKTTIVPVNQQQPPGPTSTPGPGNTSEEVNAFLESDIALALLVIIFLALIGAALASRWDMSLGSSIGAAAGVVIGAAIGWIPPLSLLLAVVLVGGIVIWRKR